jgi:hypothetical protein
MAHTLRSSRIATEALHRNGESVVLTMVSTAVLTVCSVRCTVEFYSKDLAYGCWKC